MTDPPPPASPPPRSMLPASAARMLPRLIVTGVVLCIAFIAALDIGYLSMSRSQATVRERMDAVSATTQALDRLQALMVDAETAARGYLLVGRESMLQPYHRAKAAYADELNTIAGLTADDPAQQEALETLRGLVVDKWAILASTIESFNRAPATEPRATESTADAPGKLVMDAIRDQVSAMNAHEAEIRLRLAAEFRNGVVYTRVIVFAASALALLALVALSWAMRRYVELRARAEVDLRGSEERYRVLTEVAPQISWMADLNGEMIFCNQQWTDYTGLTLEQTMAAGSVSVVHRDDRVNILGEWRRAIADKQPFEVEVRLRRASDGAHRWHLARARALQGGPGRASTWFGAAVDIDDRKVVEIALDQFNANLADQVAERTASLEQRTAQLKALNQHLVNVAEKERSRLARELHDELGAHLSVAMMDLTIMQRRLATTNLTDVAELARRVGETLTATTQIGRRIVSDLRPAMLQEFGLAGALEAYCVQFESVSGVRCERELPENLPRLIEEASIAIFRIVQESLSNIAKYAGATRVRLSLRQSDDSLDLLVQDDGVGVAEAAIVKKGSHGLLGIRERAEAFGGSLKLIEGLDGRGAGIMVTLAWEQVVERPMTRAAEVPLTEQAWEQARPA